MARVSAYSTDYYIGDSDDRFAGQTRVGWSALRAEAYDCSLCVSFSIKLSRGGTIVISLSNHGSDDNSGGCSSIIVNLIMNGVTLRLTLRLYMDTCDIDIQDTETAGLCSSVWIPIMLA